MSSLYHWNFRWSWRILGTLDIVVTKRPHMPKSNYIQLPAKVRIRKINSIPSQFQKCKKCQDLHVASSQVSITFAKSRKYNSSQESVEKSLIFTTTSVFLTRATINSLLWQRSYQDLPLSLATAIRALSSMHSSTRIRVSAVNQILCWPLGNTAIGAGTVKRIDKVCFSEELDNPKLHNWKATKSDCKGRLATTYPSTEISSIWNCRTSWSRLHTDCSVW